MLVVSFYIYRIWPCDPKSFEESGVQLHSLDLPRRPRRPERTSLCTNGITFHRSGGNAHSTS
jgi:hypothetical protein